MGDDIVTRLRNWHDQRDSWQTLTDAADEIERLRAIAFCRTCEPADGYYCTRHRQDEEGRA